MSNEIQAKVLRALELALLINPKSTQRERTGSKPSVLVWFSGHCANIHIDIYPHGWYFEADDNGDREVYGAYIDPPYEADIALIDKALARLEEIWAEVQEGKYNDTV